MVCFGPTVILHTTIALHNTGTSTSISYIETTYVCFQGRAPSHMTKILILPAILE